MIEKALRYLTRRKTPVVFNDPAALEPVSRLFGLDRGTPVDRYYVEKFLEQRRPEIRGRVLEVGDSSYSRRFGAGRAEAYEVLHVDSSNPAATIIGDLTDRSTLPAESVDCFICTQTFNFIFEVQKAVFGAHHLLRPGGTLLATMSGISQISRYDMDRWGDYWRFTTASARQLFEPVFGGGVEIESFGNVAAACAFLQGVALEDLPDRGVLDHSDPDYQLLVTVVARKAL